jgi:hypothetical protein
MDWFKSLFDWAKANEALLWWLFGGSLAIFLLTPVVVAWTLIRLPTDYFIKKRRRPLESWKKRPVVRFLLLAGKNLLGAVLLVAGLVMLLVPGQGLLTIAVGLVLVDFPGKFRLERSLVRRRAVWQAINWLRKRLGREPLKRPA